MPLPPLNNPNGQKKGPFKFSLWWMYAIVLLFIAGILYFDTNTVTKEVSYSEFEKYVEQDHGIKKIVVLTDKREVEGFLTDSLARVIFKGHNIADGQNVVAKVKSNISSADKLSEKIDQWRSTGAFTGTVDYEKSSPYSSFLWSILPFALFIGVWFYMMRKMSGGAGGAGGGGGIFSVGKSKAMLFDKNNAEKVTFRDVAGLSEAKTEIEEIVEFLKNPKRYTNLGGKIPKGALLVGPPGTGKTLLAKAVAGEAHVPFFSLSGSDFIELYVGVGASRVRALFKGAEKNAPCIVFIDEIDAIGRSRDTKYGGGNEEREQTLNQLLSEMDGFDGKKGIIILAATNRPEILDKALLRPGRFDRRIIVDKPDLKGRVEILKVHAKDVRMDETVDLNEIALATSGAVGSDLANMINEAAINAVKTGREYVSQKDLFDAVEQVLVGKEKKDRIMSKEERKIVSYHEVGHALVSALQKNSEPVQKITIVPRTMGALGYVMHVPEEEKYLDTEAELRDRLVGLLGGRAAEEIVFDTVTTGAANDIEQATSIARNMVTRFGMSKKFGGKSVSGRPGISDLFRDDGGGY